MGSRRYDLSDGRRCMLVSEQINGGMSVRYFAVYYCML